MNENDLDFRIERVRRLAAAEIKSGPQRISSAQTVTVGGDQWAFCKTAAGTGNTLVCFLGRDTTGPEVTVYFNIYDPIDGSKDGDCDLNTTDTTFYDGLPIRVAKRNGQWWYIHPLEVMESIDCGA